MQVPHVELADISDDPMSFTYMQASLMINETEKNLKLTGGAVHFQSQYATQQLGALRYVSTGVVTTNT